MPSEVANYDQDVEIDESILDVMWIEQPRLMLRYSRIAAHAHQVMDLAEERVNFVKSRLSRDIRSDPAAFDVTPGQRGITEEQVKAAIRLNEEYRAATRAFITAKYEFDVALGASRAFDQRRAALENLVRLHGQQYFAGPAVPHDLSAERQRHEGERALNRRIRTQQGDQDHVHRGVESGGEDPSPTRFRRGT